MFIVDLVMPPGKSFPGDECSGGTFTGLFLAHDLRKKYKSTPIVLYSFTSFRYVTAQAKRVAKILRRCAFVRKADYPPVKLVEFIGHYFERGRFPSGILRRLVDSLVVEPNVHGVGIDLKKALRCRRFPQALPEIVAFRFCQYYGSWTGHHIHRKLSRRMKEKYFYPS